MGRRSTRSVSSRASSTFPRLLNAVLLACAAAAFASPPPPDGQRNNATVQAAPALDWPMWGGTPRRNMVSNGRRPPTVWDVETRRNIRWSADLGSHSFGEPVVADGVVYVGTNNEGHRDPKLTNDAGMLMAFDADTGKFLWQKFHAKLPSGRVNDWPGIGLCSPVYYERGRIWYCSNRCEVICLDVSAGRRQQGEPPVVWKRDMMGELGVFPHNMTRCAIAAWHDYIYVVTGNGVDDTHKHVVAPDAPDLVCFDKNTGRVVWSDNSPGNSILHGQWSSAAIAEVNGRTLVIVPLGDAWVRAYDAETGKIVWKFDANPKETTYPTTRNEVLATPVIVGNKMYIANGQDPEHGEGNGHLWCVRIDKEGDVSDELLADPTAPEPHVGDAWVLPQPPPRKGVPNPNSGVVWHFGPGLRNAQRGEFMHRSISNTTVYDGLAYIVDFSGFVHCLDAQTGKACWHYDLESSVWGSMLACDGKVYVGNEDGHVLVFAAGRRLKLLADNDCGTPIYGTPVYANGTLYVQARDKLLAIGNND